MTMIQPTRSSAQLAARWSLLAAALFLIGSNGFMIAGVLPEIAAGLRVSAADVGFTITAYALLVAVLSPVIGIVAPRTSRTLLMVAGLVVFLIGVAVAATATSYAVFIVGRLLAAVGGAAIVPTATAAAAALAPPARRGTAIAVVGLGFTLALAVGAPLGTAIAAGSTWRAPMFVIAAGAVVLAPSIALIVRDVPVGQAPTVAQRLLVLRDGRTAAVLLAVLLITAGFNLVYIFSSAVTGYRGAPLAALLLIYGLAGIVGNAISGPLTDRWGSRLIGGFAIGSEVLALAGIAVAGGTFLALSIGFAVWGFSAFATTVPLQHRLLHIDPQTAPTAVSWYSTALYLGIACAPVLGAVLLDGGSASLLPIWAALLGVLALGAVLFAHRRASGSLERASDGMLGPATRRTDAESTPGA